LSKKAQLAEVSQRPGLVLLGVEGLAPGMMAALKELVARLLVEPLRVQVPRQVAVALAE
jgi:hypothetical protein